MPRILNPSDFKFVPWKNGQGVTTEIFRMGTDSEMFFRVSSAEVAASGPFSDFAGYKRTLINLGPGTMTLSTARGTLANLMRFELVHFDGGSAPYCAVTEPCADLNVFCKEDVCESSTTIHSIKHSLTLAMAPGYGWLVFGISGYLKLKLGSDLSEWTVSSSDGVVHDEWGHAKAESIEISNATDKEAIVAVVSFRMKAD